MDPDNKIRLTQLIKPLLVPASGELCFNPGVDNIQSDLRTKNPATETEHVGIIMLTAHPGRIGLVAKGCPDITMPVGGNGHTNAGSTDQYPPLTFSALHLATDSIGKIRVIHRISGITACIINLLTNLLQKLNDQLLKLKTAVIAAHCYFHAFLQVTLFKTFHDNNAVGAAKTKGVGHGSPNIHFPSRVGYIIKITGRVWIFQVHCRRSTLMMQRQGGKC